MLSHRFERVEPVAEIRSVDADPDEPMDAALSRRVPDAQNVDGSR